MCGIYVTNIPYENKEVYNKLKGINYRGPDNLSVKTQGEITLGHLRLSILDLDERSNQPYNYNHLHIVFNGEVYNFNEIKVELISLGYDFETTSDTEVLIKGYAEWGEGILSRLNGMFAFAILDTHTNEIFCARDRLGVKPLYFYWSDGAFEICSQLRPMMHKERRLSEYAISIYLDCGYIPSPFSIFENVYKLLPGNYLKIDLNKRLYSIKKYWDLTKVDILNIPYIDAKNKLHELLIDSVKIRLQADVPLGSFLSGGIDSALVSSIAAKISDKPINTFSIGFTDPKYDESNIAAEYAKIIGSNHHITICDPVEVMNLIPRMIYVYDEPFADSSALPSLLLNSVAKEYVTVALSGDGGDESFLGYKHFSLLNDYSKIEGIPHSIRKLLSIFPWYKLFGGRPETIKTILRAPNSEEMAIKIFTGFSSVQKVKINKWLENYDFRYLSKNNIQKAADLNIKLWLENDSNVKVDRASMASSVEVRSPFLDYRIIEFARQLPVEYRFQKGKQKRILRDILKEYIPEEIFDQPKKGFSVPMGRWIREDLKDEFESELNDAFLYNIPNLDLPVFKKQYKLHMSGKNDYSSNIWRLFVLSKWCKEFEFYPINN